MIGATMTQRPDIAKVFLPAVGVMDMLRFHKFTIGWAWAGDYGTSADEKNFKNLLSFSPLHNIKNVSYPATLVTTADHDDRVVPAHSFKFAATLQENQKGSNPVLIRIDVNAGHGAGKPTSKSIEEMNEFPNNIKLPVCLTIAGLDPSGGAGIIADIKTFSAFGCFAAAAVSSVTFQNTTGVFGAVHQTAINAQNRAPELNVS